MRYALKTETFDRVPGLLNDEFKARTLLAETFSSPEIEAISKIAQDKGAKAVKICGAGGGGCAFVWVDGDNRSSVIEACTSAGYKHLDVAFL